MRADRLVRALGGVAAAVLLVAPAARAQSLFERLGLDRLRFDGVSVAYGPVDPVNVLATRMYGLHVDYGNLAPHVQVLFGVDYWGSRFSDAAVSGFVRQLQQSITDPSQDDTVHADKVRVSDVLLQMQVRWTPASRRAFVRPYFGGGLGMSFVSAHSKLIDNTFVGRALNDVAIGVTGVAGVELAVSQQVSFGAEADYTLVPSVPYASLRAVVRYTFRDPDPERAP